MTLARHQRSLERAVRGEPVTDRYAADVIATPQFRLLQQSVRFWRLLGIQRGAPLTAALLAKRGLLNLVVDRMIKDALAPRFDSTMAEAFLEYVAKTGDEVAAALARTETALHRVARGDEATHVIEWPIDPSVTLAKVLDPASGDLERPGRWRLRVARHLPGYISATSVS